MLSKRIGIIFSLAIGGMVCHLSLASKSNAGRHEVDARIDWIFDEEVKWGDTASFWSDRMILYGASTYYSDPYDPNIAPERYEYAIDLNRMVALNQNWMGQRKQFDGHSSKTLYPGFSLNSSSRANFRPMSLLRVSFDDDTLLNVLGSNAFGKCQEILAKESNHWRKSTPYCLHCYYTDSILYNFTKRIILEDWMIEPTCDVLKHNLVSEKATFNRSYCLIKKIAGSYYLFHMRYFAATHDAFSTAAQPYPITFDPEVLSIYHLNEQKSSWIHLQDIFVRTEEQISMKEEIEFPPVLVEMGNGGYSIVIPAPFEYHHAIGTRYFFLISDMKSGFRDSILEEPWFVGSSDLFQTSSNSKTD